MKLHFRVCRYVGDNGAVAVLNDRVAKVRLREQRYFDLLNLVGLRIGKVTTAANATDLSEMVRSQFSLLGPIHALVTVARLPGLSQRFSTFKSYSYISRGLVKFVNAGAAEDAF